MDGTKIEFILSKNVLFVNLSISVCFEVNCNMIKLLYLRKRLLDTGICFAEFFSTTLRKGNDQNLFKNGMKKVKNLKISLSFCLLWNILQYVSTIKTACLSSKSVLRTWLYNLERFEA